MRDMSVNDVMVREALKISKMEVFIIISKQREQYYENLNE